VPQPSRAEGVANGQFKLTEQKRMIRTEALQAILGALEGNEAIIATTGKTGRELFTIADRPNHLYVVGGMGTASAIGLGLAQARPKRPVVVIDGDGAALMKLGSLATVGYCQPANLLHILLDNESHDSTGGQRTASSVVHFTEIAAAANYRQAVAADDPAEVSAAVRQLRHAAGPSLLHIKLRPGSPKNLGRPTVKPHEVKERFMQFLHGSN
jgi:phosphonopyruvate decarboxylase